MQAVGVIVEHNPFCNAVAHEHEAEDDAYYEQEQRLCDGGLRLVEKIVVGFLLRHDMRYFFS